MILLYSIMFLFTEKGLSQLENEAMAHTASPWLPIFNDNMEEY